ncbi:hypothetical protein B9Z55_021408 [Caenorhabditis nigoni]|uniref:DUF38 domain-containing protein n=1 Tax=Caenorhabditis nigoni TaxID=1611254 RepID=A0A2G5TSR7_9PELO|nr:hypothetical protein B9Z55_021408 [Caenorhabditis nigoni]
MPYAYDRLTNQQKNSITQIQLGTVWKQEDTIELGLQTNSPLGDYFLVINYKKLGTVSTVVFENEELPPIDLHCLDVLLEDLEMLLKHRKSILPVFLVHWLHGTAEDRAKICEGIEMILKSIRLRVQRVEFHGTTVAQAMSIIQCFNRSESFRVTLSKAVDPESFENYSFLCGLRDVAILQDGEYIIFVSLYSASNKILCFRLKLENKAKYQKTVNVI